MDPITVPTLAAVLSAAVGGAAGQAGRSAWESLSSFVRGRFGRESRAVGTLDSIDRLPDEEMPVEDLASLLVDRAEADAEFASWLRSWLSSIAEYLPEHARPAMPDQATGRGDGVSNVIGGSIGGHAVQARDIHGSIDLGGTSDR